MRRTGLHALAWTLSGASSQAIAKVFVLLVLVRLLTPNEFGLVSAAIVVISIASAIAVIGVGPAIVQHARITDTHLRTADGIALILGISISGVVFFGADVIERFFGIGGLAEVTAALSVMCLLHALSSMPSAWLERGLRFRALAIIEFASYAFGYGFVSLLFAATGAGAWALVYGYLAQSAIQLLCVRTVARQFRLPALDFAIGKELLGFGMGFLAGKIFRYSATEGDNLVIGRWLGAESLGLYGRAYHLLVFPAMLIGKAVNKVLFPFVSLIQTDKARVAKVLCDTTFLLALVMIPLSAYCWALADEIILLLLGTQWIGAALPFRILSTVMLCRTSAGALTALADAQGAVYGRALRDLVYGGIVLLGALVGLQWGIAGVALGVSIALLVYYVLMVGLTIRTSGASGRELLIAHLPGLIIALASAPPTIAFTTILRSGSIPPLVRLLAGTSLYLVLVAASAYPILYRMTDNPSVVRLRRMVRDVRIPLISRAPVKI